MTTSLVIVNPHAGGGHALTTWQQIEAYARARLGSLEYVVTDSSDEVAGLVAQAATNGMTRIISMGGDGTNHHVVNALMRHNRTHDHALTYATIPAGTGRDWSRGVSTPLDVRQAIDWIATTRLRQVDIGQVWLDDRERFFLNVSSIGVSSRVIDEVEAAPKGGRITFLKAILKAILRYQPVSATIHIDDELWWDGPLYLAAVANGRSFGQGLLVAPNAEIDDGRFDVIGAEAMRLTSVLRLLVQLQSGAHLFNRHVRVGYGHTVRITSDGITPLGVDLDGEGERAHRITLKVLPQALAMNT